MADELQKAKAGEKLSDKATEKALDQALDALVSQKRQVARVREQVEIAANELVESIVQHAVAGVAGAVDGATGDRWCEVKGVPVKLAGGLLIEGMGIFQAMQGKKMPGVTAVGRALVDIDLYRIGRQMGGKWKNEPAAAAPAAAPAAEGPGRPGRPGAGPVRRINWQPPQLHLTEAGEPDAEVVPDAPGRRRMVPVRALR